ncbi:MAG: ESPR domain-containing protein [Dialister pneumosintes]
MNKVYKLVWSKAKNCYVVASEFAKRHTKEQSGKLNRVGSMALTSCLMVTLLFVGGTEMAYATNQVGSGNGISFSANADAGVDPKNIALGDDSKITSSVAIAIGHKAKAEEHQSIAMVRMQAVRMQLLLGYPLLLCPVLP